MDSFFKEKNEKDLTSYFCKICHIEYSDPFNNSFDISNNLDLCICFSCWVAPNNDFIDFYNPEIHKINEKIFLGNQEMQKRKNILKYLNISNILVIGKELQIFYPNDFLYKKIDIEDGELEDIFSFFEETFKFIEESENNIFVHCLAGVSRSSTIVIAYFMRKYKKTYKEAYVLVRAKRLCINPNEGFVSQLEKYQEFLQTKTD